MVARRFVKAGACFDDDLAFVQCALDRSRCLADQHFLSSLEIEETQSINHPSRDCLQPHEVQSIYGGRCPPSNGNTESFCTGDASGCPSGEGGGGGNFVYDRQCTILANFLDGEYSTSVYGTCHHGQYCAFSESECPGEWKPATGLEGIGGCTCLRVRTGACVNPYGGPYCAVSAESCGVADTFLHVKELKSTHNTMCFLCANPFNPFNLWPTSSTGSGVPGKSPLDAVIVAAPATTPKTETKYPIDFPTPAANKETTEVDSVGDTTNLVGIKVALSLFVVGVLLIALFFRLRRRLRESRREQAELKDCNLHGFVDEDTQQRRPSNSRQSQATTRLPDWTESLRVWGGDVTDRLSGAWNQWREGFMARRSPTNTDATAQQVNTPDSTVPQDCATKKTIPNIGKINCNEPSAFTNRLTVGGYDRDLLYEVAMEGDFSPRVSNEQNGDGDNNCTNRYTDDHLLHFDRALEKALAGESDDEQLDAPSTTIGESALEPSQARYEDIVVEGSDPGETLSGPIVEMQDNGSMLV